MGFEASYNHINPMTMGYFNPMSFGMPRRYTPYMPVSTWSMTPSLGNLDYSFMGWGTPSLGRESAWSSAGRVLSSLWSGAKNFYNGFKEAKPLPFVEKLDNWSTPKDSVSEFTPLTTTSSFERLSFSPMTLSRSSFQPLTTTRTGYTRLSWDNSYKTSAISSTYRPVVAQKTAKSTLERAKALGPEFLAKVKRIANNINCDYKDLLAVMNSESGFNSKVQNQAGHQAYGLIQFTPEAAEGIGTSISALLAMTPMQQLDYVEKFYVKATKTRGMSGKRLTGADLYALTFLPARANEEVLCVRGERYTSGKKKGQLKNWYEANAKAFDHNGDGKITKSELQMQIDKKRVDDNIFAVA